MSIFIRLNDVPIDVNFHLQFFVGIFDKNSAAKKNKKNRRWKLPCLMPIKVKGG
jgi:hypothetical protein